MGCQYYSPTPRDQRAQDAPARKVCSTASMYCRVYCRVPSLESLTLGTVCPSGNLALGTMVTCPYKQDLRV